MDVIELRKLSDQALREKLQELHKEAFNLRFQHAASQLENTARIRQVRRAIARANTLIGERARNQTQEV